VNPERFRDLISGVLIVGVVTSAALMVAAFAAALVVGWDGSLRGLPPTGAAATDFSAIVAGILELRPIALAQAGLLVLLATPVLRVMASVVAFALEGDRLYVAITVGVLAILLLSIFGLNLG
jgi:uncharacterized membrane protein